jgi:hypothetical protein
LAQVEHDDEDFVANLADSIAPLTELVSLPLHPTTRSVAHSTTTPSHRARFIDHFYCFGCGGRGSASTG